MGAHAHAPFRALGGDLWLKGLGICLPEERVTVEVAVADGSYRADHAERDGYRSVRMAASGTGAAELGLAAAEAALAAAGSPGEALSLLVHTGIHAHGHRRLWQPAAWLQRRLSAHAALAWSLSHGCNAQTLSMLEAGLLIGRLGGEALCVGADRFDGSGFDRWRSDIGLVYGDAAAAALLSPEEGFARILYMDVESIPDLEEMHRMDTAGHDTANDWDIAGSKKRFLSLYGKEAFIGAIAGALDRLRGRLADATGVSEGRLAAVVTPFLGASVSDETYGRVFHPLGRETAERFGRTVGHTGTADQLLGLADLLERGRLKPGDRVLLIGAGAGFTASAILVELQHPPRVHRAPYPGQRGYA